MRGRMGGAQAIAPSRHAIRCTIDGFRCALPILRNDDRIERHAISRCFSWPRWSSPPSPVPAFFTSPARTLSGGKRGRHRLDVRDGARRAGACDRGRRSASRRSSLPAPNCSPCSNSPARSIWSGLASRRFARRATCCRNRSSRRHTAGVSGRRAGRSPEPEDRGVLPGLHSAIRRPGRRLRRAPVHHARPDLGGAQHAGRRRRGDDGRDGAQRSRRAGRICFNDCDRARGCSSPALGISLALARRPAS